MTSTLLQAQTQMTQAYYDWQPISCAPVGAWLRTKREGEACENICAVRMITLDSEPEWVERETGRTTVTHHSFLPPTHWRWPNDKMESQATFLASARKAGMEEAAKIAEEASRFDAGMPTDRITRASRAGSIASAIRSAAKAPHNTEEGNGQ